MVSNKIAKELIKKEKNASQVLKNDVEYFTILIMSMIDKNLKGNYINSKTFDDLAYSNFVNSLSYNAFDAHSNKGLIRSKISSSVENKILFLSGSSWEQVVVETLYSLNKVIKIDNNKEILNDKEMQYFFNFKNEKDM